MQGGDQVQRQEDEHAAGQHRGGQRVVEEVKEAVHESIVVLHRGYGTGILESNHHDTAAERDEER
ncbi:hypothetical protein GCM10027079_09430 [Sediminivirga luteola]|uniref:Uncharacterized protein n=1 Tax=Sediminivirga luteola TaxID=1774748 RepID=A0A8J2TYX6_9MICO|nr:hypothetical protein GCM10011333_20490 [Sediminivirga luteola]